MYKKHVDIFWATAPHILCMCVCFMPEQNKYRHFSIGSSRPLLTDCGFHWVRCCQARSITTATTRVEGKSLMYGRISCIWKEKEMESTQKAKIYARQAFISNPFLTFGKSILRRENPRLPQKTLNFFFFKAYSDSKQIDSTFL